MRVLEVQLRDFRRFDSLRLEFAAGLNLLAGPNGAGKSTVLEGLRFAIFGLPPRRGDGPAAAAVRQGSEALTAEVLLLQGGHRLRIRRSLGPDGSNATLEDSDSGSALVTGVEAVDAAIAAALALGSAPRLLAVAERLLGGAPPDFVQALALPEAGRTAFVESLLALDGYEQLATRTRELARESESERLRLDQESRSRQGEIKGFLEMSERLALVAREAERDEERLRIAGSELAALTADAEQLERCRAEAVGAELALAVASEALRSRMAESERARGQLDEAEHAAGLVQKAIAAHARFETLETECRDLELRLGEREALRAEVARLEARLAEGHAAIAAERDGFGERMIENQNRAEAILLERDGLRAELEFLRSRSRRAEGARNALELARERTRLLAEQVAHIPTPAAAVPGAEAEAQRREAEARRAADEARDAAEAALAAELRALRARAMTADDALARVNEARDAVQRLERLLEESQKTLEQLRPTLGACPFLAAPCQNLGGKSLVAHFEHEVGIAQARHASALEAERFASARLEESREAERALEERTRRRSATASGAGPAAATREHPPTPRTRPSSRARLPFEDIGHQLFSLAGVLGALDLAGDGDAATRALIGAVAGIGTPGEPPRRPATIEFPDLAEIEAAQRLAHDGKAALDTPASPARDARVSELAGSLALAVRHIVAATERATAQASAAITISSERSRAAEEGLLRSSRELEALAVDRARLRAATKELSSRELKLLDIDIALTDRRVKLGAFERIERELARLRREQAALRSGHESFQAQQLLAGRVDLLREEWKNRDRERLEAEADMRRSQERLSSASSAFSIERASELGAARDRVQAEHGELRARAAALGEERGFLSARLAELGDLRARIEALEAARRRATRASETTARLARAFRALRGPVGEALSWQLSLEASRLWRRMSRGGSRLEVGPGFALSLREGGSARAFAELSRGEQVRAALAFELALLPQFPGLGLLLLDEPTAHLDRGRVPALAHALREAWGHARGFVEQAIVASHDEALRAAADTVIRL